MSSFLRSTLDLLVVLVWTLVAVAAVVSGLGPGPLRIVLTLPLVVLLPGYALLAFLFPERPGSILGTDGESGTAITSIERYALSVVASIAVVPIVAFAVNYTSYQLRLRPLLFAVAGLTVGLTLLGYVTRLARPAEHRHGGGGLAWFGSAAGSFLSTARRDLRNLPALTPTTGTQRLLNILFVVSVLTLAATVGYAAVNPAGNEEPFSEFYLLSQTDDGEFVAEDLPKNYTAGESKPLHVAIGNHEGQSVPYTVVVKLDGKQIDRFSTEVDDGQTKRIKRSVTPTKTGDRLRMSFLLYRGDVPNQPTPENAYRETHLWVSVDGGS